MRIVERIPVFLNLVDLNKLTEDWKLEIPLEDVLSSYEGNFQKTWEKYYDLRFGQLLINLGLIYDNFYIWNVEEDDILKKQGVKEREYKFWGSVFDEHGLKRPNIVYKLIKDLDANHLNNIIYSFKNRTMYINEEDLKLIKEELAIKNPNNKKLIPLRLEKLAKEIVELDKEDYELLQKITEKDFDVILPNKVILKQE